MSTQVVIQDWELLCSASLIANISEKEKEMAFLSNPAMDLKYPGLERATRMAPGVGQVQPSSAFILPE